jgi:tetratricopeptide (TPR) repeat protein
VNGAERERAPSVQARWLRSSVPRSVPSIASVLLRLGSLRLRLQGIDKDVVFLLLFTVLGSAPECDATQALARQAYGERRYQEAASHFARALDECGASATLLLGLGQAQLLARNPAGALATLDRISADEPDYAAALKVKAKALYLLGRDAKAEEALRQAAARSPSDAEIPYSLGRMYHQQRKHAAAAEAFRRATALDPRAYMAWDNLGLACEALGDVAQAQKHYLTSIALVHKDHPDYDVVYANFAELMIRLEQPQRAFDLAAEAAGRNPREPRNLFLAGKALVQLGRSDLSIRWFEQAVALDDSYPEAHYALAQAYRRVGRTADADRALAAFKTASARAPRNRR